MPAVMFSQATRLLAVWVIVCVVHLTPTVSQCTTKNCFDDNNDNNNNNNDINVALTAMVTRLQDTVERLEWQHQHHVDSMEKQDKQHQDSIEQLQQQFNDSLEQQQEYVIKVENTMKEKISTLEEGMIYIFFTGSRLFHAMCFYI